MFYLSYRLAICKRSHVGTRLDYQSDKINVYFLQKHVRKVVGGVGKKSCVSTGVKKPAKPWHPHMCSCLKNVKNVTFVFDLDLGR